MEIRLQLNERLTIKSPHHSFRVYCDELGQLVVHDTSEDLTDDEKNLVIGNCQIAAIRAYRKRTGASLLDAKNLVRGYADGLKAHKG